MAELGEGTGGIWVRRAALELMTLADLRRQLADGTWQVVWPGVYADGGYDLSAEQRAFAAVLASGGDGQPVPFGEPDPATGARRTRLRAVAAGRTAARVWQLPLIDDDDPATGAQEHLIDDVKVWGSLRDVRRASPRAHDPMIEDGTAASDDVRRTLERHRFQLGSGDLVRRASGLWITSLPWTLVHCASLLSLEALVCMLDDALHRRLMSVADLDALVAARQGLPGGPALAEAVSLADGRAESPGETLARLILKPSLPDLEPQVRLYSGTRIVARFDLGDRNVRLAVELDGKRGHAGTAMAAKDHRRDRTSRSHDWWTERATWYDCRRRRRELRDRVVGEHRRLLASRR